MTGDGESSRSAGASDAPQRVTPGALLTLIRTGAASSRTELIAVTRAPRSAVSAGLEQLLAARLVVEGGRGASTGGRPPRLLSFNESAGVVIAVQVSVDRLHLGVTDLSGHFLDMSSEELDVASGPETVMRQVNRLIDDVLGSLGRGEHDVWAVGVGVPGPVEFGSGRLVYPPLMTGWHDYEVPAAFARFDCPVVVDNDVNMMALGELRSSNDDRDFLVVKVGADIGCGIVLKGEVYRGTRGCAGDIGHVYVPDDGVVLCRCGNENCLDALAGGAALARHPDATGLGAASVHDLVRLAVAGEPPALELVRNAGRRVGCVVASLVNILNPNRVVLMGALAAAGNPLLAGIRETVYRRSLPLAARSLEISISETGETAGLLGAASLAIDTVLAEDRIDSDLRRADYLRPVRGAVP